MATVTASAAQLALYRSAHRIVVEDGRCRTDMIPVHPIRGGWRHDVSTIAALMEDEYGRAWPSSTVMEETVAVEVARDAIREEFYR